MSRDSLLATATITRAIVMSASDPNRSEPVTESTGFAPAARVVLLDYRSIYARYVRERPWWALLAVSLAVVIARRRRAMLRVGLEGVIAPPIRS